MKLQKALKEKKKLIGEISKLKEEISRKNSYLTGSKNAENFNSKEKLHHLKEKIDDLVSLKYLINDANRDIQSKIYILSEYKSLIAFWNSIDITEGTKLSFGDTLREFNVHFNESDKNEYIEFYQKRIDVIQDEIDEFNHTTHIPWGE